jgi:hypothetical protein
MKDQGCLLYNGTHSKILTLLFLTKSSLLAFWTVKEKQPERYKWNMVPLPATGGIWK